MKTATKTIDDRATLREHFGEPLDIAVACEKDSIDEHHKRFIDHSPFMCLASADENGQPSVSPKGDAPGFVRVIDERTLLIPDRPGNNKVESFGNLMANNKVALVFFVPGISETLRIKGEARLVLDEELLKYGQTGSKLPPAALIVDVKKAYVHCGKAMIRSKLWDSNSRVADGVFPPFGQVIKDQIKAPMTAEQVQAKVEHEYEENLY